MSGTNIASTLDDIISNIDQSSDQLNSTTPQHRTDLMTGSTTLDATTDTLAQHSLDETITHSEDNVTLLDLDNPMTNELSSCMTTDGPLNNKPSSHHQF